MKSVLACGDRPAGNLMMDWKLNEPPQNHRGCRVGHRRDDHRSWDRACRRDCRRPGRPRHQLLRQAGRQDGCRVAQGGTFSVTEKDGATATDPKISIANVKDGQGNTLVSFPLDVDVDGKLVPVKTEVKKDGAVLEVTPQKPADLVITDKPVIAKPSVAQDIASPMENQRAQNEFASNFGIATAIGGFVGTAIGAVIGCVLTIAAFCFPGLVAGAGIGGILGTIAVGGPALIAAGVELVNTFQAADGTTKWADKPAPAK